jgi:hypothetical protein
MSPVITRPRPASARSITRTLGLAFVLAVFVSGETFALWAIRTPGFLDRVTIENPDVHNLEIEVGDADRDRWLGLGTATREASRTFQSVIDQGDTWVFHFRYGGVDGGEVVVSRDDLRGSRWRVRVPEEVGARLTQAGLGPSGQ